MKKFFKTLMQLIIFLAAFAGGMYLFSDQDLVFEYLRTQPPSMQERRVHDLTRIKKALADYRQDHGAYPKSKDWDGLISNWGASGKDWIKGLAPDYIKALPREPRRDNDPEHQYLYRSDGKDYKLIVHRPEDCAQIKNDLPAMVDPTRDCWAYGFWTEGAQTW